MAGSAEPTAPPLPRGAEPQEPVTVLVEDLEVRYRPPSTDAEALGAMGPARRAAYRALGRWPRVEVRALDGVSLRAHAGESIGVLGANGSGKSTLLRSVAGLEPPTSGTVLARSQPVLLGVNAALVPALSGERNVILGCLAMGMTRSQARDALEGVVELSGIGQAIHRPMRTYSSGMASRLRFAISAAARPDILLIDEALGTGDAAFKERSEAVIAQMLAAAGTVFLVSHAAQTVEETCTRAIWLMRGRVVADGPGPEVAADYRRWSWAVSQDQPERAESVLTEARLRWRPDREARAPETARSPQEAAG